MLVQTQFTTPIDAPSQEKVTVILPDGTVVICRPDQVQEVRSAPAREPFTPWPAPGLPFPQLICATDHNVLC